jgi:dTDP-4-amino-4,6-dideoxygalactose transaminase
MNEPFIACPGLGYSPAAMIAGWIRSHGMPPSLPVAPDRQVLLTHQGRTALGLLCTILGLGPADEVLLPAYNCGAEVDPFVHARCRVIFYRIDRDAKVDVADVLRRLSSATRLIYVTHFYGWPQDIANLAAVCQQRNVLLVEDCAQALFSEVAGNAIGKLGDAVIYSFVKSLALPDGGALVLKPKLTSGFKALRFPPALCTFKASLPMFKKWFMQNHGFWQRHPWSRQLLNRSWRPRPGQQSPHGRKEMLSSNRFLESRSHWGMSRVSLGLLEQAHGSEVVANRRRNFAFLHERVQNREQLQPLHECLPGDVCPMAYPVYAKDPANARAHFDQHGILVQGWPGYYPGMSWDEYPETCVLKDSLITLPVHQDLSLAQMEYIARCANSLGKSNA